MQKWMEGYTCQQQESFLNFNGWNQTYNSKVFLTLSTISASIRSHMLTSFDFGVYYAINNSMSMTSLLNSDAEYGVYAS